MAKETYIGGITNKSKHIPDLGYIGIPVNGVGKSKRIVKGYIGNAQNKSRLFWEYGAGNLRVRMRFAHDYVIDQRYNLVLADIKTTIRYILLHGLFLMPEGTSEYNYLTIIQNKISQILPIVENARGNRNVVYVTFQVLYSIPYLTVTLYNFNPQNVKVDDYWTYNDTLAYRANLAGENYTTLSFHVNAQGTLLYDTYSSENYPSYMGEYLDQSTGIPYALSNIGIVFDRVDFGELVANFVFNNQKMINQTQWFSYEDESLVIAKSDDNGAAQIQNNKVYFSTRLACLKLPRWFFYEGRYIIDIEIESYDASSITYTWTLLYVDCSTISATLNLTYSSDDRRWVFVNGNYDMTVIGITDPNFFSGKTLRLKFFSSERVLRGYINGTNVFTAGASKLFEARYVTNAIIGSGRSTWYTLPFMSINSVKCYKNKVDPYYGRYQKLVFNYDYKKNVVYPRFRADVIDTLKYSLRKTVYFNRGSGHDTLCDVIEHYMDDMVAYTRNLMLSTDNTVLIQTSVSSANYIYVVLYLGHSTATTITPTTDITQDSICLYPWMVYAENDESEGKSRIFIRFTISNSGTIEYFNTQDERYQRSSLKFFIGNYDSMYSYTDFSYLNYITNTGVHFENFNFEHGVVDYDFTKSLFDKVDGLSPIQEYFDEDTYIDSSGLHICGGWDCLLLPSWTIRYGNTIEFTVSEFESLGEPGAAYGGNLIWFNRNTIVISYDNSLGAWKIDDNTLAYHRTETTTITSFEIFRNSTVKLHFDDDGYIYIYKNNVLLYHSITSKINAQSKVGYPIKLLQQIKATVLSLKVYNE